MTSYFNVKKLRRHSKQATSPLSPSAETPKSPVLDEEDEKFLERLAALSAEPEGTPPPLPDRPVVILENGEKKAGKDVQEAVLDDANAVPLPMSPPEVTTEDAKGDKADSKGKGKGKEKEDTDKRRKSIMSYFSLAQAKFAKTKDQKKEKVSDKEKEKAAKDLHAAAEAAKSNEEKEAKKEAQDLTEILDQLNLSAVNNRVFSFSKESQELLDKFKLVLKDIVNGAPTAYNDLEKLLTDSENQLKKMYGSLPPFLQNLVKSLPSKMTAALGPELLAAQAEKPGFDGKQRMGAMGESSGGKKRSKRSRVPSLKQLVSAEGAVATMLRSILNFLKLRFPALMTGTNILMSLAVFLLLFVFWYCHKRGRETRLEKERLAAEEADSAMASSASSFDDGSIFEEKKGGESSRAAPKHSSEKVEPPLIIHDDKEAPVQSSAVEDMPSVLHLPDPAKVALPEPEGTTPLKEEPIKAEKK